MLSYKFRFFFFYVITKNKYSHFIFLSDSLNIKSTAIDKYRLNISLLFIAQQISNSDAQRRGSHTHIQTYTNRRTHICLRTLQGAGKEPLIIDFNLI